MSPIAIYVQRHCTIRLLTTRDRGAALLLDEAALLALAYEKLVRLVVVCDIEVGPSVAIRVKGHDAFRATVTAGYRWAALLLDKGNGVALRAIAYEQLVELAGIDDVETATQKTKTLSHEPTKL